MKQTIQICFLITATLSISCQQGALINVSLKDNMEKVIESEFKLYNMPGLAVLSVKGDSIIYEDARGYADVHQKKLFTPQTRMLIASISKTMAVTAIMQLYEK